MLFLSLLTKGQIFRYMALPQILPRLNSFFEDGFKSLAVFMALVYRSVKLLPDNHPYLQPSAARSFTVRDVVSAASAELKFDLKHIDQVVVFFALIAGIILLALQFVILLATMFVNSASAADMPSNYRDFFNTPDPGEDLALRLLDSVFGVPNLFNSNEAVGTPYHEALQGLFQLYSIGLLVIGGIILAYFIFVVLAETAQTGTPFGKRYNHAWAPIRLVVGIALLIPIGSGFNSAQWITLYAAKFGSGFATVGWNKFNETVKDEFIEKEKTVAAPNIPELNDFMAFMMIAHACKEAYSLTSPDIGIKIDAWIIDVSGVKSASPLSSANFQSVSSYYTSSKNIYIRFGEKDPDQYKDRVSGVFPYCGDLVISNSADFEDAGDSKDGPIDLGGFGIIEAGYFELTKEVWTKSGTYSELSDSAVNMMQLRLANTEIVFPDPSKELQEKMLIEAKEFIQERIDEAIPKIAQKINEDTEYKKYGWGGAGIYYNRIANVNGRLTTSILNKPQIKEYPKVMEYTCKENRQQNKSTSQNDCYIPSLSKGKEIKYADDKDRARSSALSDVFNFWYKDPEGFTENIFIDTINAILGTEGVFSMCQNADIHPLAQLSTAGKGLIEAAIRNIGFSIGGGLAAIIPYLGPAASAAGGFFGSIASIGLLLGFILYYMIPFLPFLYFFFAVGTWIRGIFEAMVGVPLWALAHIRIDGEGLPGQAAASGYYLIFEVFVRPILIVFGLLASVLIFAAMVKVLNEVFYLVASNASGFDGEAATVCGAGASPTGGTSAPTGSAEYFRGPVDQFFFTVLYAVIVYLTAMSSFKLIDMIPNKILRWMGSSDKTFSDDAGQTAEGVLTKVAVGGSLLGGQISGVGQGASKAGTDAAKGVGELLGGKQGGG